MQQGTSGLVVKMYTLCYVSLWFKSYKSHFVTWNVSNINYNKVEKKG
jgi:hypothetical protein